jgi:uncharacterized protein YcbX
MPRLHRINIFPIKSFPGHSVTAAQVLASGGLKHDRRWALVDRDGQFVTAKRTARMHLLRARFAEDYRSVTLSVAGESDERMFSLEGDRLDLAKWLSDFFGLELSVAENTSGGFPDDTDYPGPTVVSVATLETTGSWFDGLPLDDVRQRFRANLEVEGVEPFWEDRLVGKPGSAVPFAVGAVTLEGMNPCQRCPVPTRDPSTGEALPEFAKRFARAREATLPAWAEPSRFDHFYRLAVNTRLGVGYSSGVLHVGDEVKLSSG